MSQPTQVDKLLSSLKNNRYLAGAIVAGVLVIAAAQLSGAIREIRDLVWSDDRVAQSTYRALIMDLNTTEKALRGFSKTSHSPSILQLQLRHILKARSPFAPQQKRNWRS